MKYDAKDAYKQARKQGKMRRFLDVMDGENMAGAYMDSRYKTDEEINEELRRGRLRDLGEAIGCFVAVVLGSVAMYLFLCL